MLFGQWITSSFLQSTGELRHELSIRFGSSNRNWFVRSTISKNVGTKLQVVPATNRIKDGVMRIWNKSAHIWSYIVIWRLVSLIRIGSYRAPNWAQLPDVLSFIFLFLLSLRANWATVYQGHGHFFTSFLCCLHRAFWYNIL